MLRLSKYPKISRYWHFAFDTRKEYRFSQILIFLFLVFMYASPLNPVNKLTLPEGSSDHFYLSLTHAINFLLIAHFFVRPFLKMYVLRGGFTAATVFMCTVYCFALATVQVGLAIGHAAPYSMLGDHEITSSSVFTAYSSVQVNLLLWMLLISNHVVLIVVWSVLYSLGCLYDDKRNLSEEVKNAQSEQLFNQLNPHFLFNAFNSIRALIHEDKEKAADMLTNLSDMFREHLLVSNKPESPLRDEWSVAKRYLELEQVRLETRMALKVEFADECLGQSLPTFSLLSLAENAVKHGISYSEKPGYIHISAERINRYQWKLIVRNSMFHAHKAGGAKTGLKNLKARLNLLYQGDAELVCNASSDDYRVSVILKYSEVYG